MKAIPNSPRNSTIDQNPSRSNCERERHQGSRKIISISNKTNNIAII
jgi:hypothetical protein